MATLTVTLTEALTLNGSEQGGTNTLTISSITDLYKRIVTVPSGVDTTLCDFHSTVGVSDGTSDLEDVKYVRITNLDSSNPVNLSLQVDTGEDDSAADSSATILLEAGKTFMMGSLADGIAVSDANATILTTLNDLESIIADSISAAVQVEVFVAME